MSDDDSFIAEVTRQRAAAETLRNIQAACPGGIPLATLDGTWLAANAVVTAYLEAAPLPSPIRTSR